MDSDADLSILNMLFKLEINIALEHNPFPANFYEITKPILGKDIELIDLVGNHFHVHLFKSNMDVMMWEVIPQFVQFYGLSKNHFLYLKYNGGHVFEIEIKDEEEKDIIYPIPNDVEVERNDVIVISSDSEEEGDGGADAVDLVIVELDAEPVDVPAPVYAEVDVAPVDDVVHIEAEVDAAHAHGAVAEGGVEAHPWFEKTITRSQASGRQPLVSILQL